MKIMVSVIIPMYNGAQTIKRALDSVNNQIHKDLEIIIVNDGSIDEGAKIVDEYIKDNDHLNITLINKENAGVSSARNIGMNLSKGNFIAFLDSDDEWMTNKLVEQLEVFDKHCDLEFLTCIRNNEKISFPYNIVNGIAEITLRKLLIKVVGQTSTAIFKRHIIYESGYYDEDQKYSEDANYWMKISLKHKMAIFNKSLVITGGGKANYGESGLSANLLEMERGVQKNIDEFYRLKEINLIEYILFKALSKIKYYKRYLTVRLR